MLQKNWQTLIKPKQLSVEPGGDANRVATVVAEVLLHFRENPRSTTRAAHAKMLVELAKVLVDHAITAATAFVKSDHSARRSSRAARPRLDKE